MGNTVSRLFGAKDSKSSKSNTPNGQQTTAAAQSTTAMAATTTTTKSSSPSTSVVNPIGQDVIDSVEKHGYLFGLKLAKSLSPLLHSTIYRGIGLDYGNYRLESDDISLFLELIKHPKFYGELAVCLSSVISSISPLVSLHLSHLILSRPVLSLG